jgi:S-adenosylmethionine:tRNA ribosyltransferase-isomerase
VPGELILLADDARLDLLESCGGGEWEASLQSSLGTIELLDRIGLPPLPPYIRKVRRHQGVPETTDQDRGRYNTIYARESGSVAAPTAGLHFTPELLDTLAGRGIQRAELILHVGMGTFAPVRTARLEDHQIHREAYTVPAATIASLNQARDEGRRIVPVGTTTVRALESLPQVLPAQTVSGETSLFILPGARPFPFRFADGLMTNFHLPRSTLLALVGALPDVGVSRLLEWYQVAIDHGYRFYSYGDAMLIL